MHNEIRSGLNNPRQSEERQDMEVFFWAVLAACDESD
jgi:hypothetical protein